MNIQKFEKFKLNENINFDDISKTFLDELSVDVEELKNASYDQINNMFSNASTSGIYFTDEHLLFTSGDVLKNWKYYAGLEYVSEEPSILSITTSGTYLSVYHAGDDDRINDILDQLNEEIQN